MAYNNWMDHSVPLNLMCFSSQVHEKLDPTSFFNHHHVLYIVDRSLILHLRIRNIVIIYMAHECESFVHRRKM